MWRSYQFEGEQVIQKTSLEAYEVLQPRLGYLQKTVYNAIQDIPDMCNHDIAYYLRLEINRVTPRVKELRDKGLVVCSGHKKDESTNKNVMIWKVVK